MYASPEMSLDEQLISATREGRIEGVRNLLKAKAKVDAVTGTQRDCPFHTAVRHGYEEIVRILLEARADVNAMADDGQYPLHIAVYSGHNKLAEMLLRAKASADLSNAWGQTPLYLTINAGKSQIAKTLLSLNANPNGFAHYYATGESEPLLASAIKAEEYEIARLLLDAKADIQVENIADLFRGDPLHYHALKGNVDQVKHLLEEKADPHTRKYNLTPLALMAWGIHGYNLSVRRTQYIPIMQVLLAAKASANSQYRGETVLHRVIACGQDNMVEMLLKAKADMSANSDGTALHTAADKGSEKTLKLLLAQVVDTEILEQRDAKRGVTALWYAINNVSANAVALLLRKRADTTRLDEYDTDARKLLVAFKARAAREPWYNEYFADGYEEIESLLDAVETRKRKFEAPEPVRELKQTSALTSRPTKPLQWLPEDSPMCVQSPIFQELVREPKQTSAGVSRSTKPPQRLPEDSPLRASQWPIFQELKRKPGSSNPLPSPAPAVAEDTSATSGPDARGAHPEPARPS